jgi:predicted nucleic acid-binding protein
MSSRQSCAGVPTPSFVASLDAQAPESIWTTAITVFEIRLGIESLAPSRRRRALEAAFAASQRDDLGGRIGAFDAAAAEEAGELAARQRRRGRPVDVRDTESAGIALARRAGIATGNMRHFEGLDVKIVNPGRR